MGGDNGPHVFLYAVKKALQSHPELSFHLFGNKLAFTDFNLEYSADLLARISFHECKEVVYMDDKPTAALRHKKHSSMNLAIEAVAKGEAHACVSCGNTGALMTMAYSGLKTLSGVNRPALVSSLPSTQKDRVLLLDLGASIQTSAQTLFQYAVMGSVLASTCYAISTPRVALLNVGEENLKGNPLVQQAHELLSNSKAIKYVGFIEGDKLFSGKADVIVTDGFTGNIALKSSEGIAKLVLHEIKRVTTQSWVTTLLSKFALPVLKKLYHRMNPDQYNGASLLGLRGIVVKSHGNASVDATYYAILQALHEVKQNVPDKIKTKIESVLMEP